MYTKEPTSATTQEPMLPIGAKNNTAKPVYMSKTFLTGAVTLLIGVFSLVTGFLTTQLGISPDASWIMIVSGALHMALRFLTGGPVTLTRDQASFYNTHVLKA